VGMERAPGERSAKHPRSPPHARTDCKRKSSPPRKTAKGARAASAQTVNGVPWAQKKTAIGSVRDCNHRDLRGICSLFHAETRVRSVRTTPEDPFRRHRKDVTDWVIRRVHPDGSEEELGWGPPGECFELFEWTIKELSHQTVRSRWGAGSYRVYFAGVDETGRRRPRGRTGVIILTPLPGDPLPKGAAPLTVVQALRAGGNAALAATIEQHLSVFGFFMLKPGM